MALIRRTQSTPTQAARGSEFEWDPFQNMRELMNWDPLRALAPRLLRGMGEGMGMVGGFIPGFDVRETKDTYVVSADVPGFKEQDLSVQVSGQRMTVSGERRAEKVEETDTWYLSERSYGNFSRSFTLPDDADMDNAQADLREGVLNLRIPRSGENKPRQIPLRSGASGGGVPPKA